MKPEYFYNKENGCLYWAIQELYKDGVTNLDAYNLSSKLHSHQGVKQKLESFNLPSIQELMGLYRQTARATLEEYRLLADNIVANSFKRELAQTLKRLEKRCYRKNIDLDTLNGEVSEGLNDLIQKYIIHNEVHTLGTDLDSIWDEIVSRRNENGQSGILSKFALLNEYFTYEIGELVVLQAKYKRGKSVFLMNEVVHKLQNGVPSIVVDTEMPTRLYTERLISHITGIEVKRVKNGNYNDQEAIKIKNCIEWLKKQSFVHIYDPQMTDEKLYSICKMLKYQMGLQFVVFDYIKSNETSTSDNYNILGAKCDFLKNRIAGELQLAVLSACQLNRSGEVADSDKINRYLSVGIKWDFKPESLVSKDTMECGNTYARVYVNRLGRQMQEDDEEDYIDFVFRGDIMTITESKKQHKRTKETYF